MTRITGDWMTAPATQAVCTMLADAGYQAYFVGGCVRDALMGMPVGDIDICTDAHPDEVQRLAGLTGLKSVPTGIEHGTITVVSGGIPHEVTTFRKDVATDGRHAVVSFADNITDDARRRDFTMNALYADPSGRVVDPLNGLQDLTERRLRFIEDPDRRIREDYLRILRFFRFHARFGDPEKGLDEEALAAIAANADGIETLSAERVGNEMLRLLATPDPAPSLAAMQQSNVLSHILPGADARPVGPLVHVEGLAKLAPDPITRLAALGGERAPERLRLSRKEAAQLLTLREETGSMTPPGELGYRFGEEMGKRIIALRSVLLELPLDLAEFGSVARGGIQVFPVSAGDLMPRYTGAELGRCLRGLEQKWIASDFALDRETLLGEV